MFRSCSEALSSNAREIGRIPLHDARRARHVAHPRERADVQAAVEPVLHSVQRKLVDVHEVVGVRDPGADQVHLVRAAGEERARRIRPHQRERIVDIGSSAVRQWSHDQPASQPGSPRRLRLSTTARSTTAITATTANTHPNRDQPAAKEIHAAPAQNTSPKAASTARQRQRAPSGRGSTEAGRGIVVVVQPLLVLLAAPSLLRSHGRSGLQEGQYVRVDRLSLRGRHAMREPRVGLQRPVLQSFADSGPESA